MNRDIFRWAVGIATVLVIVLSSTMVIVRERHTAIITRFGELQREIIEPGLTWKLPWPVDRAHVLDARSRVFDTRHTEMLTSDKTNVVLLSYVIWSIEDPLEFFRSVGDIEAADEKLDGLVTDAEIGVLGRYKLSALVSTNAEDLAVDAIEQEILAAAAAPAREKFGVAIEHFGFKRLSLPEENISSVFNQMRAERQQYAAGFRAQGERDAAVIRSETDLDVAKLVSEAKEKAAKIRGEAEAEAARIYAEAHGRDPELYRFLRQLESLESILGEGSSIILRTDRAPFGLLKNPDFMPAPFGSDS